MFVLKYSRRGYAQRGLSMIELMVSMVIGLVIMGAVLQAFLSTNQSYRIQNAQSRIQEDGRAAIHFVAQDIRAADFWGCLPNKAVIKNQLDSKSPDYVPLSYDYAVNPSVNGIENNGVNSSDSLILRGAASTGHQLAAAGMANVTSDIVIKANMGLSQNHIVLISDCLSGDIIQITNNPEVTGSATLQHGNKPDPAITPGNARASLSTAYSSNAEVFTLQNTAYSVVMSGGAPTLQRNGLDLVPNIEEMQVLFGEDTDANFSANYYVSANNVVNMDNVVSIRVAFLVRSNLDNLVINPQVYNFDGRTITAQDNRIRHVFTTTVSIRNRGQ
ncbi:PilW family protein [Aliamphritea ceti]|uniref:PilW family protein n=1 Tax=Aliamphritea ceti TaxID=1524258 RepID=UPI0021C48CFB|nr:PilW family protein [Aliamphritea ceti]